MATIIKGKAEYGGGWICFAKKGGCGAKFEDNDPAIIAQQLGQMDNPDPYDLANTLVKMSSKRAYVDAALRTTATSGLFTQDLEDLSDVPPTAPQPVRSAPQEAPRPAATAPELASPAQVKAIYIIARNEHQISEEETDERSRETFGAVPAQLTKRQASEFIDKLKGTTQQPAYAQQAPAASPTAKSNIDDNWTTFWITAKDMGYRDEAMVAAALGVKGVNQWIDKGGTMREALELLAKLAGVEGGA